MLSCIELLFNPVATDISFCECVFGKKRLKNKMINVSFFMVSLFNFFKISELYFTTVSVLIFDNYQKVLMLFFYKSPFFGYVVFNEC